MENPIIKISNLTKKYGSFTAVDKLNLNIQEGEIFGLLGPNGAGKSTTIRMLLGLSEPTEGEITVFNFSSVKQPIKVKEHVGYLPEDVGFYNHLTAYENLMFTARLNGMITKTAQERILSLLDLVGLSEAKDKKTATFSRGMKQRLGLADVLIKEPKIIILDEPTLGLDPKGMQELLQTIKNLSQTENLTVLFSSHHLHQVQHICDRVGLFVKGGLVACGDINTLSHNLFSNNPYTTIAEVKTNKEATLSNIIKELLKTEGIVNVEVNNNQLTIECSEEVNGIVASTIVKNQAELISLNQKKLGLNDIYNRYFEGGQNNE